MFTSPVSLQPCQAQGHIRIKSEQHVSGALVFPATRKAGRLECTSKLTGLDAGCRHDESPVLLDCFCFLFQLFNSHTDVLCGHH